MRTDWPVHITARQHDAIHELVRRLYAAYNGRLVLVALFGSVARGDFTADSDIDILVVANDFEPDFKWGVWGLGSEVSLDHDMLFNLHVYPRSLWQTLQADGRRIHRDVEREGIDLRPLTEPDEH